MRLRILICFLFGILFCGCFAETGDTESSTKDCSEPDQFRCDDGGCIRREFICDELTDCDDGSDEDVDFCNSFGCAFDFICYNGQCLDGTLMCDGNYNCEDKSDEDNWFCPVTQRQTFDLVLDENQKMVEIRHLQNDETYRKNEDIVWTITNEDAKAVGFEVFVEKCEVERFDKLTIKGRECSFGTFSPRYSNTTLLIKGRNLDISWTSDNFLALEGFILKVSSLYEFNQDGGCFDFSK